MRLRTVPPLIAAWCAFQKALASRKLSLIASYGTLSLALWMLAFYNWHLPFYGEGAWLGPSFQQQQQQQRQQQKGSFLIHCSLSLFDNFCFRRELHARDDPLRPDDVDPLRLAPRRPALNGHRRLPAPPRERLVHRPGLPRYLVLKELGAAAFVLARKGKES